MELQLKKKEIVSILLKRKILVSKELLAKLDQPDIVDEWHTTLTSGGDIPDIAGTSQKQDAKNPVSIIWEYTEKPQKRTVADFVNYFNARYRALERILHQRQELRNLTSINRLRNKRDREPVSVIGLVSDIQLTKNDNYIITVEDTTGTTKVLLGKNKPDLYEQAKDLVFDEVIGVHGTPGDGIIFANSVIIPDIPHRELKKAPDDISIATLSCVHVGSTLFEHERFANFVQWTKGELGDDSQKELARKLKYIFITGDLVDGVGIYPGQEHELLIPDIKDQYKECARLLSQIPEHITLVLSPGNHDASRIAEPQPKLSKEYAQPLWDLPNAVMVCNPCVVNIHASETFPGFDILLYHGYSFDDYGEIVESIRNSGKHLSDRAPLIMRFLLQRRHLAPQHTSTLYIPDPKQDPLVINHVPDIFLAGHIHKAGTLSHRNVSLVCGSCFQGKTDFQERVGHEPEPGVVPVIDLHTRHISFLRF